MYPSVEELITENLRWRLPFDLTEEIVYRYAQHGPAYMSENTYYQGRLVNTCMTKDSWQDLREEVVDAVFNALVLLLKFRAQGGQEDLSIIDGVLAPLCHVYNTAVERQKQAQGK